MGRRYQRNRFAQRKRERKQANEAPPTQKPDGRIESYVEIVRDNEAFINYYKRMNICAEAEFDQFLQMIRSDLPTTFRITGSRGAAKKLLNIIKTEFFNSYVVNKEVQTDGTGPELRQPISLPWYPNDLAWQLELTRRDIRRSESLYKLHNFLIAETNVGSISRQEAVSMIPPLVLDVQPHHKVLDMCAAPGSKTAQLIEALHARASKLSVTKARSETSLRYSHYSLTFQKLATDGAGCVALTYMLNGSDIRHFAMRAHLNRLCS